MALDDFDEQNSISWGLDSHALVANEKSIFESAGDVITKGIPLTGLSVLNSFYNTAVDIGNFFGGDFDRAKAEDQLEGDWLSYYKEHSQGIEAAGLVAGSLVPGLAAVKALKLLQGGVSTGILARATGIFSAPRARIIENALAEVEGQGGLFANLTADKYKAIALGFGDQALQGLVYEAATVGTMKASPLLDKDGYQEVISNMFFGALVGGGVGGVIEGLGTRAIFNRAKLAADVKTKPQELQTRLGKGDYEAGDAVVALLDSIERIPEPTGVLGEKKLSYVKDSAALEAKRLLKSFVGPGDEELTNNMFDMLVKMKHEGQLTKEEMYHRLAGLAEVTRVGDATAPVAGPDFFINKFKRKSSGDAPTINDLWTNDPHSGADVSLGYRQRQFATEVKLARSDDLIEWEGQRVARYKNSQEAFDEGHDLFYDTKLGRVVVNPNAPNIERVARVGESRPLTTKEELIYRTEGKLRPNSKPLLGDTVILDVLEGGYKESVVPVPGDYGKVRLFDKGLAYGDKTSLQSLDSVNTATTPTIDASSRHIWAAERGIKSGDTIQDTDIAMLEQLYREGAAHKAGWVDYIDKLNKRGVSIGGSDLPLTQDEALIRIRQAKDNFITELMDKNKKLSAEEVAQRANVPLKYLEEGFQATEPSQYMLDPEKLAQLNHVQMSYNIGNIYQQDGMILRGLIDVQYRIQLGQAQADAATAKFFGEGWEKFKSTRGSNEANIEGAGPGFFSASNAKYGSLGQMLERIGRNVTTWSKARMGAISDQLSSVTNSIRQDAEASAELGMFIAVRRRSPEAWTFLPGELVTEGVNPNTVVLRSAIKTDKEGKMVWDKSHVPDGFTLAKEMEGVEPRAGQMYTSYVLSDKVAAFERSHQAINDARVASRNDWYAAQGLSRTLESGNLYAPPIDTSKYSHFALVRQRAGTGLADDSVAIITAENAKELEQKIAILGSDYSVYTKDLIKKHHEVLGDYDYNRNFAQSQIDAALKRKGILNNVFPDTRAESIVKDYIDWHTRQDLRLTRDYVELGNAQLFAELRAMGERFTAAETSRTGFTPASIGRTAPNPYNSYIKTALGVSEKEEYRLWADANEKLESFFSTAFRAAKSSFVAASKGMLPYEEAAKVAEKFGLGNPYGAATNTLKDARTAYEEIANKLPPERYLSKFVATANSILSATAIRLDVFQSIINAVSTPVLLLAEANSARGAALKELVTTELPDGSGRSIPAASKLLYNSIANWFSKDVRDEWMPVYKSIGAVRDKSSEFHEMIDQLSLPYGKFSESEGLKALKKATDLGARLTGSELSEEFGRFIAADVGRQLFSAVGHTGQDLTDNITTLVNRVHGNYVASQRPVAFQGPIGQAVGLFQTYQFNLLQQLFRYVENGEAKTIALLSGMQTTLFGFQGLPGFQAINNHIVGNAAGNPGHKDIYSITPNFFDPKLGNYLLYGVTSNWLNTGLYSRGDINPRQITILPTNPLDYPAISGGIRFVGSLLDTADKIAQGGSVGGSVMLGLEHNGLSRPLSGIAQLVQGFSSTGKGSLVAATSGSGNEMGLSEMFSVANFGRLLGARPLDEAIAMDAMYRRTLYTAKNNARVEDLGEAVKTTLYRGDHPSTEEVTKFAAEYANAGGHIEAFGRKMIEWSRDANSSVANQLYRSLKNPLNQRYMEIMGGTRLPDYSSPDSLTQVPAKGQ